MSEEKIEGRGGIISVISTPIQLAALIVLVVEALLAFLLSKANPDDISLYVAMMVGVLVITIIAVFIIEDRRLKLKGANVIPDTGVAQYPQKTYKWDVFLAAPMAALVDEDFENATNKVREIKNILETECGFSRIFFAGNNMKTKKDFQPEALSLEMDVNELKESRNFIMIYPDKIVSSVLFEAGIALALGKPSFYFGKTKNFPYLMQQASQEFGHVKVYNAETLDDIIEIIHKNKTALFSTAVIRGKVGG